MMACQSTDLATQDTNTVPVGSSSVDALERLQTLFEATAQDHLQAFLRHANAAQKQALVDQIHHFESWYAGGLENYLHKTRQLLKKQGVLQEPATTTDDPQEPKVVSVKDGQQQEQKEEEQEQDDEDDEWKDWTPSIPQDNNTKRVASLASDFLQEMEEIGLQHIGMSCFVIVAGGLGERLGYKGIKLSLPVETITRVCYLEAYIRHFLALQHYARSRNYDVNVRIPVAIMTSDDTHAPTLQLLEQHHYFGMHKSQVTLIKQEKVPCIDLVNGRIRLVLDPNTNQTLLMKPHGHGDVHTLLYQSGLANQWHFLGKRYVHFIQDTNYLIVNSINTMVGSSVRYNWQMNSTTVLRKAKDASGAIVKFTNQILPPEDGSESDSESDNEQAPNDGDNSRSPSRRVLRRCSSAQSVQRNRTGSMALAGASVLVNIEYNELDGLLRKKFNPNGDVNEANGYSCFPGNINHLVFALDNYVNALEASKGFVPEFLNPKFANASKTCFKAPARLECMMQDYPKLLMALTQERLHSNFSCNQLGFAIFEPWMVYSPCKNDLISAASKVKDDIPPQCASSAEHDLFAANAAKLRHFGANIGRGPLRQFAGITVQCGPHILLSSDFALSVAELKTKIVCPHDVHVTGRSTLILEGEQILLQNLTLDGALKIHACAGAKVLVKNLCVQNAGYVYHELTSDDHGEQGDTSTVDPVDAMRGYKIIKRELKEIIIQTPGDYVIHGDVVVRM